MAVVTRAQARAEDARAEETTLGLEELFVKVPDPKAKEALESAGDSDDGGAEVDRVPRLLVGQSR